MRYIFISKRSSHKALKVWETSLTYCFIIKSCLKDNYKDYNRLVIFYMFIYIIKQDIRIYIYVLSIAGLTAGPNGWNFLWTLRLWAKKMIFFLSFCKFFSHGNHFDSIINHDSKVLQKVLFAMRTSSENLNKLLFWHNQKRHLLLKKVKIWDILS